MVELEVLFIDCESGLDVLGDAAHSLDSGYNGDVYLQPLYSFFALTGCRRWEVIWRTRQSAVYRR